MSKNAIKEKLIQEISDRQLAELEDILFPNTDKHYIYKTRVDKVETLKEILLQNMLEALTADDPIRRDIATKNFARYVFAEKRIDTDEVAGDTVVNVIFDSLKPAVEQNPKIEITKETNNAKE